MSDFRWEDRPNLKGLEVFTLLFLKYIFFFLLVFVWSSFALNFNLILEKPECLSVTFD